MISNIAGVQVRSMGGLGSYGAASIRGSTPNQVLVFIDGIHLNIGGFSVVNLSDSSLEFIDRVEVYLGNAPPYLGRCSMPIRSGYQHAVYCSKDGL